MIRTFRFALYPTPRQATTLAEWLEACRALYNAALEQRITAWRHRRQHVGYNAQTRELTRLRKEDETYGRMPVLASRSALKHLERAYTGFFRRVRSGEAPGFPRFRGRNRYDSFAVGPVEVNARSVLVPRLGPVRVRLHRSLVGAVKDVILRRSAKRWWVCVVCDLGPPPEKVPVLSAVGVDLGLSTFATVTDGTRIPNPRYGRRAERWLADKQRTLSRRRPGSRSWGRAKNALARAHEHVRESRMDFLRKVASRLLARHDLIAHEAIPLDRLTRTHLSKSLVDAAWGLFVRVLASKAECAGKWVVSVCPRGTSCICSGCGAWIDKGLRTRVHRCTTCGLVIDRDLNAARNILRLARQPGGGWVPAAGGSFDSPPKSVYRPRDP
jgi:putative transposase